VGVEASADGGMGEVSLHDVFLLLHLTFDGIELSPLSLYVGETRVLGSQGVDVCDNTCIPKVE
jgi:hypothetical protein